MFRATGHRRLSADTLNSLEGPEPEALAAEYAPTFIVGGQY